MTSGKHDTSSDEAEIEFGVPSQYDPNCEECSDATDRRFREIGEWLYGRAGELIGRLRT